MWFDKIISIICYEINYVVTPLCPNHTSCVIFSLNAVSNHKFTFHLTKVFFLHARTLFLYNPPTKTYKLFNFNLINRYVSNMKCSDKFHKTPYYPWRNFFLFSFILFSEVETSVLFLAISWQLINGTTFSNIFLLHITLILVIRYC